MTLQHYDPAHLDQFALQLLDLAATIRRMARRIREEQAEDFRLNDRKALDWLERLSIWVQKAESDLGTHVNKSRGARLARKMLLPDNEE